MAGRYEHRKLLRQAMHVVARDGVSPRLGLWGIVAATRLLLDHLQGRSPRRASEAAATFVALYERSLNANPPPQPLACRNGCAFCCHSFVAASAPELFLLANEIRRTHPDRIDDVRARVETARQSIRGLDKESRSRLRACALLVENSCSAYSGRPIACRAFASFSFEKCEQAFRTGEDDIPVPAVNFQLRGACNQALWSALSRVGLPFLSYELTQGLHRVLSTPDAERRWLAGENILAGVQADEVSVAGSNDPRVRFYYEVVSAAALGEEPPQNSWL